MSLRRELRAEAVTAARVALAVLVTGPLVGLVWRLVAPLPALQVRDSAVFPADGSVESAVAADGWFAVTTGAAGLACAVAVFAVARWARLGALVGLTVGGSLAALVSWQVGTRLGPDDVSGTRTSAADGTLLDGPLRLSATGVLMTWPLIAVIVWFALVAGLEPRLSSREQARSGTRFPVTVLRPAYAVEDVDRWFARVEGDAGEPEPLGEPEFRTTRLRTGYDRTAVDASVARVRSQQPAG